MHDHAGRVEHAPQRRALGRGRRGPRAARQVGVAGPRPPAAPPAAPRAPRAAAASATARGASTSAASASTGGSARRSRGAHRPKATRVRSRRAPQRPARRSRRPVRGGRTALEERGAEVRRCEDPDDDSVRDALTEQHARRRLPRRRRATSCRCALALLVRHLDEDVPIVATIFDRAIGRAAARDRAAARGDLAGRHRGAVAGGPCVADGLAGAPARRRRHSARRRSATTSSGARSSRPPRAGRARC